MRVLIRIFTSLVLLCFLWACAVTPTGRKQLTIVPEAQLVVMGVQSFHEIQDKTPRLKDERTNAYVQCVAESIIRLPQVQSLQSDWEVVVFDDKAVNAFALPGGKIGVYKGLLDVAETADQLAAVIGHEVGHVLSKHGNERVSQQLAINQTLSIIDSWVLQGETENRGTIMSVLGIGGQVGVLLPFSRLHESEADEIGQELMARAGFDPSQSIILWKNMAKNGGSGGPEFLSTHPSSKTRVEKLTAGLKKTQRYYEQTAGNRPHCH